jgi:hypothetical protein
MDAVEGNYPTEPVEEEKQDENEEPKKEWCRFGISLKMKFF